jgi:enoyl-CoA hydratase/carnithine racemase
MVDEGGGEAEGCRLQGRPLSAAEAREWGLLIRFVQKGAYVEGGVEGCGGDCGE